MMRMALPIVLVIIANCLYNIVTKNTLSDANTFFLWGLHI